MSDLGNADVELVMAHNEQVLDLLIDSFRQFAERDRAQGATDDQGALGGVGMLADKAVQHGPSTSSILLSLAVRRLAKTQDGTA